MMGNTDWSKLLTGKVRGLARTTAKEVLRHCFVLWVLLRDPTVPRWARLLALLALLYFLIPFDLLPDFLPGGLADDIVVLVSTIAKMGGAVTEAILQKAWALLPAWCRK